MRDVQKLIMKFQQNCMMDNTYFGQKFCTLRYTSIYQIFVLINYCPSDSFIVISQKINYNIVHFGQLSLLIFGHLTKN